MRRFLVEIQYLGKNYGGWQKNDNSKTVQEVVETALEKLFSAKIKAEGCSRTDAGVNARQYFFHFDADTKLPDNRICYKLNRFLPNDIVCQSSREVPGHFHARKNVSGKTYVYRFYFGEHIMPLINRDAYFIKGAADEGNMEKVCSAFVGKHDFSAFKTDSSSHSSPVKTIFSADIEKTPDCYEFIVTGDGFLYNMVRIIAGVLIKVGLEQKEPEEVREAVEHPMGKAAGPTAPAHGLTLVEIKYLSN